MSRKYEIPLEHKSYLTIEEASIYSGISEEKLKEITNWYDCPFVLWVGNRKLIKKLVLDDYVLHLSKEKRRSIQWQGN